MQRPMWEIRNQTPYGAERNWTRDKNGVHHWIVAVRATFMIGETGELTLADEQKPPVLAPEYHGKPGASSLLRDSDLLAIKHGTDIILDACAHAPGGKRVSTVPVSIHIGDVAKTLHVHGDRVYYKGMGGGLVASPPRPFSVRPIRYEHAFGGTDTTASDPARHARDLRNPIGVGFSLNSDRLVHQPAPSVEYPNANPATVGPAGFGPIDPSWSPRREYAGTYDANWERTKKPLLPDDYQDLFAACAPSDQRVSQHLRGGEVGELKNLTPAGLVRFELPKIYLTFKTYIGSRGTEHRARLTAVAIETENMQLSLVWQSTLRVEPRDDDYLDKTVVREKPYLT